MYQSQTSLHPVFIMEWCYSYGMGRRVLRSRASELKIMLVLEYGWIRWLCGLSTFARMTRPLKSYLIYALKLENSVIQGTDDLIDIILARKFPLNFNLDSKF